MVRNHPDDNVTLWAPTLRAFLNAHNLELVKSGCTPSKGTGDWDVDIASGTAIVGQSNGEVSVSSQTVALTDPANDTDMDSGESRIDLVTVDSAGSASATEGTAASNPASPDIPAGEVLLAHVHIANGDSTIADSDLFDPRVLYGPSAYPIDSADIATDAVDSAEIASSAVTASELSIPDHIAVENDTFGDVTEHTVSTSSTGTTTLVNVSASGVWLGGHMLSEDSATEAEYTVDGSTTQVFTPVKTEDGNNDAVHIHAMPPIAFDSSLKIDIDNQATTTDVAAAGWSKT